ncbi:unnamed protein product [Adineta ricciae]|uniref:Uncharacterized protein n=1 Tax=Adineta ricciae TaxID=249248 RepID=A0A815LW39_ADIRI|nr:unnamed protein product [Adineta ricciae]CAF1416047.1 unnamed protein product [Adineta ricciae]
MSSKNAASTNKSDEKSVPPMKYVQMKQVIPSEMEKLKDLSKWPIVLDVVGNLKTFYRINELCIDFQTPLTAQRVQCALQRAFFGLSFHSDGSIDDHRQFTIPPNVNRLIALVMVDKDIGECVEELRKACAQIHPDLFDAVFSKADVSESGRDDLDRLFLLTQTPDKLSQTDYYQFQAKTRSEVPLMCVWISDLIEIPEKYENFFGPRFKLT